MSSSLHSVIASSPTPTPTSATSTRTAGKSTNSARNGTGARKGNRGGKGTTNPEAKPRPAVPSTGPNTTSAPGEHPITLSHRSSSYPTLPPIAQVASAGLRLEQRDCSSGATSSSSLSEEAYFSASSQMNSSFATEPLAPSDSSSTSSAYEDALHQDNDNIRNLKNVCLRYNFQECLGTGYCSRRHTRVDIWDERVRISMGLGPRTEDTSREICTMNLMGKCRFGVFCIRSHGLVQSVPGEKAVMSRERPRGEGKHQQQPLLPPPPSTWTLPPPPTQQTCSMAPPILSSAPSYPPQQCSTKPSSLPPRLAQLKTQAKAEIYKNYLEGRCRNGDRCTRLHPSSPVEVHNNMVDGESPASSTVNGRQSTAKPSAPIPVPVPMTAQASALLALLAPAPAPAQSKTQKTVASTVTEQNTPKVSAPVPVRVSAIPTQKSPAVAPQPQGKAQKTAVSTDAERQSTPKASAPAVPVPATIPVTLPATAPTPRPQSKAQKTGASTGAEGQSTPKASAPAVPVPVSAPVPAPRPQSKAHKTAVSTDAERQSTPKASAPTSIPVQAPTSTPQTLPAPAPRPQSKAQKTATPTSTERQSTPKASAPAVSVPAATPSAPENPPQRSQQTSPLPQTPAQPKSKGKSAEVCLKNLKGKCRAGDACPRSHGSVQPDAVNEIQGSARSSDADESRQAQSKAPKTAALTVAEQQSAAKTSSPAQGTLPASTPPTSSAPQQSSPLSVAQPKTQGKGKVAEIGKKETAQTTIASTTTQQQNTAKTSAPVSVPSPPVSVPASTSAPQSDSGECEEYQSSLPYVDGSTSEEAVVKIPSLDNVDAKRRKKGGRRHNKNVAGTADGKSRNGKAVDRGDMIVEYPPESRTKLPRPAQPSAQTTTQQIVVNLPSDKSCDSETTDNAASPISTALVLPPTTLRGMCLEWTKGRCALSPHECEFTHKQEVCIDWRRKRCARRNCMYLHEVCSPAKGGENKSTDDRTPLASDNKNTRNGKAVDRGDMIPERPPERPPESRVESTQHPRAPAQTAAERVVVISLPSDRNCDSDTTDDGIRPEIISSKKLPGMCLFWAVGHCWYGPGNCRFTHEKQVCPDWLRGRCTWENCAYLHEQPASIKGGESESTDDDKTPQASDLRHSATPATNEGTTSTVPQPALFDRNNTAHTVTGVKDPVEQSSNTQCTSQVLHGNRPAHVIESQIISGQSSNVRQLRSTASVSTMKTAPAAHDAPLVPPGLLRSPSDSSASSSVPLVPPGLLVRPPVKTLTAVVKPPTKTGNLAITVLTSTRVTLGPGLEVLDVRTGFESSWILLGNLPPNVTEHDIRSITEMYGEVLKVIVLGDDRRKVAKSIAAKIEFSTPDQAAEAVEDLHGADAFSRTIIARLMLFNERFKTGELRNCSVRIEFPAPGKIAYAGYATEGEAEWAIAALNNATIRDQTISAAFYEGPHKLGPFMVKFDGLPADMDTQELQSYGIAEGCMLGHAAYQSLDEVLMKIRCILEEFGDLVSFELNSRIPKNGKIRAWARFVDPQSAEAAQRSFSGRKLSFLDDERVWLSQMHIVAYNLSREIYASLASDLDSLQRFMFLQSRVTLSIFEPHSRDSGSRVKLRMSGRSEDAIRRYKPLLEQMLNGEKLELDSVVVWDAFFTTHAGVAFINAVSRASKAYVRVDDRRDMITLYGSCTARQEARRRIINHVYVLRARHTYSLRLSGRVISQLLATHLTRLHEEIGRDNVGVDITTLRLFIRGDQKTVEHALQILARNTELGNKSQTEPRPRQSTFDCPICYNEVEFPVTLECGHQACKTCMVRYIKSAADLRTFPLTCLGNDATCGKPLSLWTIRELLSKSDFKNLVDASFRQYVQARSREFRYCPSADCPQVYRGAGGKVLQCPSCLIRICSTCNKEDHGGTKCKRPYEVDEELFQKWRNAHDVKSCPGCEAPIEKNEGCNHLTCSQCHTHICWVCLKTFARGFGIYEHMKVSHGGIGLED